MEIYGTEGTLIASSSISSNHGKGDEMLRLRGPKQAQKLEDIEIPKHFTYVPAEFPLGTPFPVGQMYALFAKAVLQARLRRSCRHLGLRLRCTV
jgi:hypothetical protein